MNPPTPDAAALRLMRKQCGYARVEQLYKAGLTKDQVADRVRKRVLERIAYGLVSLPDPDDTPQGRAMRGVLTVGNGAVACLWTAAELHHLDAPSDDDIHVVVLSSRRRNRIHDVLVHRTRYLPAEHVGEIDGVPATSLPRTIVDCASRLDRWSALRVLDSCGASRSTWRAIHVMADTLSNGRAGVRAVAEATAPDGAERIRSTLERLAREALRLRGVPQGEWNVTVADGAGRVREVDLCYRNERVIVEFDGLRFHRRRSSDQRDRSSDRRLLIAGWRVLRFTWEDVVHRPAQMANDVSLALGGR